MTQESGLRDVLAQVTARLERVEREIEALRTEVRGEINELRRDQSANFRWIIGLLIPMWVSIILTILFRT